MLKQTVAAVMLLGLGQGIAAAQEMTVQVEAAVATAIEERQPVNAGTEFPADVGTLYGWTRITGAANTTIEHVWRHQDHEFVVPLNIGGSPWRIWSSKVIPAEWDGEWTFEVRDAGGNVLHTTTFTVGSGM